MRERTTNTHKHRRDHNTNAPPPPKQPQHSSETTSISRCFELAPNCRKKKWKCGVDMDGTAIEVVLSRRLTAPQCRTIHHKSMFARCVGLVGAHMFVYVVYIGYFNLDYIYIYVSAWEFRSGFRIRKSGWGGFAVCVYVIAMLNRHTARWAIQWHWEE